MKKSMIVVIVLLVVLVGTIGWALTQNSDDANNNPETTQTTTGTGDEAQPNGQTPTEGKQEAPENAVATKQVEISGMNFQPASITVKKGTTVTWTNRDSVEHNVQPDKGDSEAFRGGPLLAQGESYSFTFDTPGTYAYHCSPHPQMTAIVTVTE